MVQGLVRLTLLAVLLLSGCAVTPPAEKAEPVTADTELQGSPAMALLSFPIASHLQQRCRKHAALWESRRRSTP